MARPAGTFQGPAVTGPDGRFETAAVTGDPLRLQHELKGRREQFVSPNP